MDNFTTLHSHDFLIWAAGLWFLLYISKPIQRNKKTMSKVYMTPCQKMLHERKMLITKIKQEVWR